MSSSQMCEWILENLGDTVPLHFTAFHPDFKMRDKSRTPDSTLRQARSLAMKSGIKYCYLGNILDSEGQATYCPACQELLISRDWHSINTNRLQEGKCPDCGEIIAGIFH